MPIPMSMSMPIPMSMPMHLPKSRLWLGQCLRLCKGQGVVHNHARSKWTPPMSMPQRIWVRDLDFSEDLRGPAEDLIVRTPPSPPPQTALFYDVQNGEDPTHIHQMIGPDMPSLSKSRHFRRQRYPTKRHSRSQSMSTGLESVSSVLLCLSESSSNMRNPQS